MLSSHFSKPKLKFLEQMLFGVSASQDCKLSQVARRVAADTLIVVDPTDIRKPCAQAMPHLATVRDGSRGEWVNGYWACVALACEPERRWGLPLMQELGLARHRTSRVRTRNGSPS
jgi:hypothetical protein